MNEQQPERSDTAVDDPFGTASGELQPLLRLLAAAGGLPAVALWSIEAPHRWLAGHGLTPQDLPQDHPLPRQVLQHEDVLLPGGPELAAIAGRAVMAATVIRDAQRQALGLLCALGEVAAANAGIAAHTRAALEDARTVLQSCLQLRADALHDPASGAMAREPFIALAAREWRRAMRGLHGIAVIVTMLDQDAALLAHGQAELERACRATALALQYSLHRPGDVVCRFDQRRFVLLLPGTDRKAALNTAQRMRDAVAALRHPLPGDRTLSLSSAVVQVPMEALTRGDILGAIDAASAALRATREGGSASCVITAPAPF